MKLCQGPDCHTYDTKDRLRGPKGNKVPQTRRRSSLYYLGGNACDTRCERDWFQKFGNQAVDYFGRITQPIKLEEDHVYIMAMEIFAIKDVYMIGLINTLKAVCQLMLGTPLEILHDLFLKQSILCSHV